MEKRILTIQDASCVGQCSLTVALPIISACGIETAVLPAAILSTHTYGFKGFTVLSLTEEFPKIINHWKSEGITFDGIYTGYVLENQLDYIQTICSELNNGLKIIDPVMADHGEFYYGFNEKFAAKMAALCANADVILPNLTEAAFLLGKKPVLTGYTKDYIEQLLKELAQKLNVKNVVLTGVGFESNKLGVAVYEVKKDIIGYYFTEKIERNFHGTGDIYSSAFVGAYFNGLSLLDSAAAAADYTVEAMKLTLPEANLHSYGVYFEKALPKLLKRLNLI